MSPDLRLAIALIARRGHRYGARPRASAVAAGPAIRPQVDTLVDRLQNQEPLADSCCASPTNSATRDPISSSPRSSSTSRPRAANCAPSSAALARSSRSELEARRRIEAERGAVRRGVQVVVLVTVVVAPVAVEQRVQADLQVSRQVPGDYLLRQR